MNADLWLYIFAIWIVLWTAGAVYAFWPYRSLKRFQRDMQKLYRQHVREQKARHV